MSAEARVVARPVTAQLRPTILSPARVVLVAAALGILTQLLFFGLAPGINVPIAAAALLAAGWRLRPAGRRLAPGDAWLPLAALAYAGFVAVRGDPTLVALDLIMAIGLCGASLVAFGGHSLMARPLLGIGRIGARLAAWAAWAGSWALADAARLASAAASPGAASRHRVRFSAGS